MERKSPTDSQIANSPSLFSLARGKVCADNPVSIEGVVFPIIIDLKSYNYCIYF